jgi:uncharacterized protein (DUF952 family)
VRLMHHLLTREEWHAAHAAGVYRPESLEDEGFIHGGYPPQTLGHGQSPPA